MPGAYLNWVLFDEHFQFVAGGTDPVNPDGGYKLHTRFVSNPVEITKNGYLFVYCSNESDINVFFDNLQLTHIQGHLLQEDTYYPFGMGIMAMSNKAANGLQNGYKYNGIAEEDNFDLGLYGAYYRTLYPQLGRWWQTDPANQFASPYLSMGNNPVNNVDPLGNFKTKFGAWLYKFFHGGTIQRSGITGEYFVGRPIDYIGEGFGVAYQRRFDWNGRSMPYLGSGWGQTARSMIANIFNVNGQASNLLELGWNSVLENRSVQLTGDLLGKIKQDPAIQNLENDIVKDVQNNTHYGKEPFSIQYIRPIQVGGKRGSLNPFNSESVKTWKVAANPLSWSVRSVNIRAKVKVSATGAIHIVYNFTDRLDLRPERGGRIYFGGKSALYLRIGEKYAPNLYGGGNRPWQYNATTSILGIFYHDVIGGNDQLKVSATWASER